MTFSQRLRLRGVAVSSPPEAVLQDLGGGGEGRRTFSTASFQLDIIFRVCWGCKSRYPERISSNLFSVPLSQTSPGKHCWCFVSRFPWKISLRFLPEALAAPTDQSCKHTGLLGSPGGCFSHVVCRVVRREARCPSFWARRHGISLGGVFKAFSGGHLWTCCPSFPHSAYPWVSAASAARVHSCFLVIAGAAPCP